MSFEPAAVIFRTRLRMLVLVGLASASVAISGRADPHPRIAGFERFYAVDVESPAMGGGWLLLTELNCLSCHKAGPLTGLPGPKPAPRLDRVGARVRPDFVRSMLLAPQHAKPGTTMPWLPLDDQVPGLERLTRPERVEALVHYLASLGELTESAPMSAAVRQGEELYHAVGCVACHDVQRESTPPLANSVPLPDLVAKYTLPGLAQFLEDPLAVRPGGRMPHLNLTGDEARQIASFLLRRLDIPANLTYRYYEGGWEKLPNFDRLAPKEVGRTSGFDVRIAAQDHFAVQFEGQMQLQREGTYRFFLHSDDGSRLYLDGELVVDNDGVHAGQEVSARRDLAAGRHAVRVEYFEQAGGEELRIEFQGPGVKRQSLELAMVAATSVPVRDAFRVDPELVRHGRELYHAVGCASCHGVPDATPATTELPRGKPLARLAEQGGCLAAEPSSGAPRFGLNARQRDQLAAVLAAWKKGARGIAADQQIRHTMQTFNCVACHARDDWGGVETARNTFFRSNQPEMGDEGRIPPHLTRVGDKLQTEWIDQLLQRGAKDRPYMFTRMPRFGAANVGGLGAALAAADATGGASDQPAELADRRMKSVGRQLVGEKGLSCVKCHTWGNVRSSGIQAISLTTMTRRLRHDWFHRYLLDPQQYRLGTRMPAAWPSGQSPFPSILDGDAQRQIDAIWSFLLDGSKANMPLGLVSNPIELVPQHEPIIYRNFLADAGSRAIGVGYPEKVNLAYDAEHCRLAMVWQGAFVDASLHWTGRGPGFQKPLGDHVLHFPGGVPIARLTGDSEPWPAVAARDAGLQFGGYRLDARRRPVFWYRWQGARVEEHFAPLVGDVPGLQRVVHMQDLPADHAFFRLAVAERIEPAGENRFALGHDTYLQLQSTGTHPPRIRKLEGTEELVIPLRAGTAEISSTLTW